MPEAAEAQLKIANIHFSEMEKPDRDFTHAVRAEQEYRQVILQYPDNQKVVAEAKIKLMQVQEVIAEREYRVGRFYYLRGTYAAAIARLQSLVDRYPLYSRADECLYLIGQSYEQQIALAHRPEVTQREKKMTEAQRKNDELMRERYSADAIANASAAYDKILTRYPVMQRSDDAKARLLALKQPVPRPTKGMLAQNKAEEAARRELSTMGTMMAAFSRHPNVTPATSVGEPTLQEQDLLSAKTLLEKTNRVLAGQAAEHSVTAQTVKDGAPTENQPAPRSDDPPKAAAANAPAADTKPDPNELTPATEAKAGAQPEAPDPNELTPNVAKDASPAPAPPQTNELAQDSGAKSGGATATAASGSDQDLATDEQVASSKHKKKKAWEKVIPGK
jgi:outer membrane protein assembly factor BamD